MLIVSDDAQWDVCSSIIDGYFPDMCCGLYTNDYTPCVDSLFSDFVLHNQIMSIHSENWSFQYSDDGRRAVCNRFFDFQDLKQKVFGYVIFRKVNKQLMWAERFSTTFNSSVRIKPKVVLFGYFGPETEMQHESIDWSKGF